MPLLRRTRQPVTEQRQPRRILVADDDVSIANLVRQALNGPSYVVEVAVNGLEAIQQFHKAAFDLVILDVMMPFVDGFEACQRIRESSDVPIVILTSRGGSDDIVHGFELGADDYITKPFKIAELLARVDAILRRAEGRHDRQAPATLEVGDLHIDKPRHEVTLAGRPVVLTPMEFELLYFLAANQERVFDRETLFREVWGYEYVGETNLVDVCVRRLREKIEIEPSKPRRIVTVRGVGYKLASAEPAEPKAEVPPDADN
ncbi:MAG: response regulator transcription factor [Herpetosiphonaceae bacterium]|nr:response regulator transcription factor [Herpetosiphonaceae bacterium]